MSDETITELARLLAEATRARRLAEAAAMAPQRAEPERGDALEAAQAQIAELRAKLADTEAELRKAVQGMMSAAGIALLAEMQAKFKRERDEAIRASYDRAIERDEARAEVEKLTIDCAQLTEANTDLRRDLAEARAALAAAHEHDAAEVARLRGLLREVENERDYLREQRDRGRS